MFLGKKIIMHWSVNVHLKYWKWKETVIKNTQFSLWCQKKSCNRWKLVCTIRCEPTVELKTYHHVLFTWILDRCDKYRTSTNSTCAMQRWATIMFTWILDNYDVRNIGLWPSSREHSTNSTCATVICVKIGFSATRKFLDVTR